MLSSRDRHEFLTMSLHACALSSKLMKILDEGIKELFVDEKLSEDFLINAKAIKWIVNNEPHKHNTEFWKIIDSSMFNRSEKMKALQDIVKSNKEFSNIALDFEFIANHHPTHKKYKEHGERVLSFLCQVQSRGNHEFSFGGCF